MFADDEYLLDLRGKRVLNYIKDITLVTNKGFYDMPGEKGLREFSFYPETHDHDHEDDHVHEEPHTNVLIGFGGSYSCSFNKIYAYYVDLSLFSKKQQEVFLGVEKDGEPVDQSYQTWSCKPRTQLQVKWYEDRNISNLCDASRIDDRKPWSLYTTSKPAGWFMPSQRNPG